MAFLDHQGESEFPFDKQTVFEAMIKAIPTIKGMKIETADKLQGRILVKAGVSLYSWGENIPIQLSEISENKTKVKITSSPKTGIMFGGAFDLGKNRKNIEQILSETSKILNQYNTNNENTNQKENISNNTNINLKSKTMTEKKKMSLGKKILIGLGIFFLIGIIANLGDDEKPKGNETNTTTEQTPSNDNQTSTEVKKEVEKKSNWKYAVDTDKMSGTKRYFASTTSTNEIEFEFPYDGGSTFQLVVRNMGKRNEVLLSVSKGQFMTSIGSSEKIRIKFDDEKPFYVGYNSADDGSMDIIFLNSANKIINKLKKAKKVMIEAPFYDAGRQIIYFDVEGLKWDK